MARFRNDVADSFSNLEGGMSSGLSPSIINQNQVAYAVNATVRGGFIRNRPKFMQFILNFQGQSEAETYFSANSVTGWSYYSPPSGQNMLVCCSGGRFFAFVLDGFNATVTEVTGDTRNSTIASKTWFCQAAQYLVAQNGQDLPWIFDGSTGKRPADYNSTMPTGRQMAYINYRLFIVLPNGREIAPGDLAYASSTSVVQFTEINRPAVEGGQPLSIPIENGYITALIASAQMDTQMGQGNLLVATEGTVCSINPIVRRLEWANITLQNVALIGNGFLSQDCCLVNGDVWGRAVDGWRSFRMARSEFQSWGNTSQSFEIQRILEKDSQNLLNYASYAYFDNRVIGTISPVVGKNGVGCYHRGMAVIDFQNITSLAGNTPPSYDGLWTGIQPYGVFVGKFGGEQRCFAFCVQQDGTNTLWEITREYGNDNNETRIPSLMETRSMNGSKSVIMKELQDGELWVDEMRGQVDFDVKWKPDQYPCWFDWVNFTEYAKDNNCADPYDAMGCQTPQTFQSQYRPRLVLGMPPSQTEPVLNRNARFSYEAQFRIAWTGQCRIRTGMFYWNQKSENPYPNSNVTPNQGIV